MQRDNADSVGRWYDTSRVRTTPRRVLTADGLEYFSRPLTPIISHPLVTTRTPETAKVLLIHRLYSFLAFTTALEPQLIVPVANQIAASGNSLGLSERQRAAAWGIGADEQFHVLMTEDIKRQ